MLWFFWSCCFVFDESVLIKKVGPKKSQMIIKYTENHELSRLTELLNIEGIGEKTIKILMEIYPMRIHDNFKNKNQY